MHLFTWQLKLELYANKCKHFLQLACRDWAISYAALVKEGHVEIFSRVTVILKGS